MQEPVFTELFLEVAETIDQTDQIDTEQDSHLINHSNRPNEIASRPELSPDMVESIIKRIPWIDADSLRESYPEIKAIQENGKVLYHTIDLSPYNETIREINEEAEKVSTVVESLRTMGPRLLLEQKLKMVHGAVIPMLYHKNAGSNSHLLRSYFTLLDRIDGAIPLVAHLGSCRTKDNELKVLKIFTGNSKLKKITL